jgi:uncharacterized protein YecE (DUF72 family)
LQQHHASTPLQVYLGCPVWADKGFVGKLYPPNTREADFLNEYAKQFNTIELNATHYRIPSLTQIAKWRENVPKTFKFFPKVPQLISHANNINAQAELLHLFNTTMLALEENLGGVFLQLPPYFKPNRIKELELFCLHYPKQIPLFVELRHESWFQPSALNQQCFDMLESYNIGTVITDVAGRRDVLHMRLTTSQAFIRFIGNDLHPTDFTRITDWLHKIALWKQQGLQQLFFFLHAPQQHHATEMAQYTINQIQTIINITLPPITLYNQQNQAPSPLPVIPKTLFD